MQVYTIARKQDIYTDEVAYAILERENKEVAIFDHKEDAISELYQLNRETYKNIYGGVSILRDLYDKTERDGIISFSNYDDAEQCAKDTGGEVRLLFRRSNSFYFSDLGYQPEYLTPQNYIERQDDNESLIIATEDEIICAAKNYMDMDVNTLYDLYNLCDEFERLVSRFRSKSENQQVIMRNGKYIFTIDKQLMEFYSVYGFYTIGVMF